MGPYRYTNRADFLSSLPTTTTSFLSEKGKVQVLKLYIGTPVEFRATMKGKLGVALRKGVTKHETVIH